ncbi:hypothetical protein L917_07975, partial [Phytophthora nicotianae]
MGSITPKKSPRSVQQQREEATPNLVTTPQTWPDQAR